MTEVNITERVISPYTFFKEILPDAKLFPINPFAKQNPSVVKTTVTSPVKELQWKSKKRSYTEMTEPEHNGTMPKLQMATPKEDKILSSKVFVMYPQHIRNIQKFIKTRFDHKDSQRYITLVTGPPGAGKSFIVNTATEAYTVYHVDIDNCSAKDDVQFALTSTAIHGQSKTVALIDNIQCMNTTHVIRLLKSYLDITPPKKRAKLRFRQKAWLNPVIITAQTPYEFYKLFGKDAHKVKPKVQHIAVHAMSFNQRLRYLKSMLADTEMSSHDQALMAQTHTNVSAYPYIIQVHALVSKAQTPIQNIFRSITHLMRDSDRTSSAQFTSQYAHINKVLSGTLHLCLLDQVYTANTDTRDNMAFVDTIPIAYRSMMTDTIMPLTFHTDSLAQNHSKHKINLRPSQYTSKLTTTSFVRNKGQLESLLYYTTMHSDAKLQFASTLNRNQSYELNDIHMRGLELDCEQTEVKSFLKAALKISQLNQH